MRAKEIDIIRTLVIFAFVLYHAMAPYTGGWVSMPLCDQAFASVYKWIGDIAYAGMLETFTAISGYVYYFTSTKKKELSAKAFITSKISRLYVPALLWGVLYWLLFCDGGVLNGIWRIVTGIGHLWYLPMLLWCFIIEKFIVEKYHISTILLAIVAILPYPELPFHLNSALFYLFFFHLGVMLSKNKSAIEPYLNWKYMLYILLIISPIFIVSELWKSQTNLAELPFWEKRLTIFAFITLRFIYSFGIVLIYFIIGKALKNNRCYKVFNYIATYAFGIYILQEFILRILYYKTNFNAVFGNSTPVIGFVVCFVFCIVAVSLICKTRFRKFLS